MADFYMSTNRASDGNTGLHDVAHSGSSGTSGDEFEFRILNDAAVTKRDALNALKIFERWIVQGGLNGAGANLPLK